MAKNNKKHKLTPKARAWAVLIVCAALLGVTALAAWLWLDGSPAGPNDGGVPAVGTGAADVAGSMQPEATEPAPEETPAAFVSTDVLLDSGRDVQLHTTVCVPESGEDWPLVVLCHGFLGSRAGDGHFGNLAETLAAAGIATIRPDFPGCGESEEGFDQYTLLHMTEDINTCIAYMAANYPVDTETIGLVGHSMGGRLASLYVGGSGQYNVDAAALWSPANGDGLHGAEFLDIENFAHVEQMADEARTNGSAAGWGVEISSAYFEGMANSHPNEALTNAEIPLLLCYTGNEGILSDQTQQETITAVQAHEGNQVVLEPWKEASHNYVAADPDRAEELNPQLDAELVRLTASFLESTLH